MSEPQHIAEVLPATMQGIKNRYNDYRREHGLPLLDENRKNNIEHRARILAATKDFLSGNRNRLKSRKSHRQEMTVRAKS